MWSEEAKHNLKSRRAIVLEPGNASMNSHKKTLAAIEGSSATLQNNYNKKKKAVLKKRNMENFQVGSPQNPIINLDNLQKPLPRAFFYNFISTKLTYCFILSTRSYKYLEEH